MRPANKLCTPTKTTKGIHEKVEIGTLSNYANDYLKTARYGAEKLQKAIGEAREEDTGQGMELGTSSE